MYKCNSCGRAKWKRLDVVFLWFMYPSAVSSGTALKTLADDLVIAAKVMASGFMTADYVLSSFGNTIGAVVAAGVAVRRHANQDEGH